MMMAEYEAALIRERTLAGLAAAHARGRKPKMTPALRGQFAPGDTDPRSGPRRMLQNSNLGVI
jgi:DNA invertase Pin-like site-specific DNA recombinase